MYISDKQKATKFNLNNLNNAHRFASRCHIPVFTKSKRFIALPGATQETRDSYMPEDLFESAAHDNAVELSVKPLSALETDGPCSPWGVAP